MVKKKTSKKKTSKKNEVATISKGGVPANLDYGDSAGKGFENMTQDDLSLPWIQLLQANSPEVDGSSSEKKIEGAQAGMLTDTVSRKLRTAEEGIIFVPCATDHKYVEWISREKGGGYVAQYDLHDPVVGIVRSTNQRSDKGILQNPKTGNDFVETFYCVGLILNDAEDLEPTGFAMVAFSSTKIKVYKKGIGELFKFSSRVPIFAHRVRITSVPDKTNKGSFRNFAITPAVGSGTPEENRVASLIPNPYKNGTHPLIIAGSKLCDEFNAGKTRVNYAAQGSGGVEDAGGDSHF